MSKAFGKIFELIRESNVLGQEPFNLFIDLRLFLSKNINNLTPESKSILVNQILSDGEIYLFLMRIKDKNYPKTSIFLLISLPKVKKGH